MMNVLAGTQLAVVRGTRVLHLLMASFPKGSVERLQYNEIHVSGTAKWNCKRR
jgi:hypothetical protein